MRLFHLAVLFSLASAIAAPLQAAPAVTEIQVWHSLEGVRAATLSGLVERFNAEQTEAHATLVYKGDARASAAAALEALRTHQLPDLIEVQDTETAHMMGVHGLLRPVAEVLPLVKSPDFNFLLPNSANFLKDAKGHLEGFPLVLGVPVLLINRDAYTNIKLDPDAGPRTWRDLQNQLVTLKDGGRGPACVYTTSRPWYIHIVNVAATNGADFASHGNGVDGANAALVFNDLLHVRHLAMTESWVHGELFTYFGHGNEADAQFASGACPTLTTSTDSLGDIMAVAKFQVGAAPLPYYQEETDGPKNPIVSGSGLYPVAGKKPEEYRAVAHLLAFLATPVAAATWTQETGSLPINAGALAASENSTAYSRVPGLLRMMRASYATPTPGSHGVRLPALDAVRDETDAQLEQVWSGQKAPKQGLDDAVHDGNQLISHSKL